MFGLESEQISNHRKCALFFSCRTPSGLARQIKQELETQNTPNHTKYLGAYLSSAYRPISESSCILFKINGKFKGWKGSALSPVDRKILIQSVTSTLPSYGTSFHKIKTGHVKQIDQLQSHFFWLGKTRSVTPLDSCSLGQSCYTD